VGIIAQFLTPDGNKGSVTKGAWVDLLEGHNGHITLLVEAGDLLRHSDTLGQKHGYTTSFRLVVVALAAFSAHSTYRTDR
jgi:hypothetical protein